MRNRKTGGDVPAVTAKEPVAVSDALFSCLYRWINGHPLTGKEVREATARHPDKNSVSGALAQKMKALAPGGGMSYEALCDSGLVLTPEKAREQRKNRQALVAGFIGKAAVKALLTDVERINRLFPQKEARQAGVHLQAVREHDPLKPHVEQRQDGLYWTVPKVDRNSGEVICNRQWLCSPLEVAGAGNDGTERWLILRWRIPGTEELITRAIRAADTGEREGWRALKAGGVSVTTGSRQRTVLADWLQQSGKKQEWKISHLTGWQHGAYIMPDGEIIGKPAQPVLFNGRSAAAAGYTVCGTAESWRASVAALVAGNPSMMLGVAAALAAPLVGLVGADGFGVHLFARSSAGKTTTANVAASLYGHPDLLRLTWYGTALGIANEAEAHNDGLLPLDEVGQGSGAKEVAAAAYTLFNGAGKIQGAKEGGNRELKRWRTVAISTGEMDIETFLASGGLKVKAGQLVRLLNVPMEKATVFHGLPSGKAHADALRDAWTAHHGAAGREWIRWLADHRQEAREAADIARERWRGLIPESYGGQVHRVGEKFAVMEAALLLAGHITGWEAQTCRDAIQHSFNAWVKEFGTGNKEHQQIIEQCEAFLNAYGMSRFAPLDYDPQDFPIQELMGYRDSGERFDDPMLFYVLPAPFKKYVAGSHNKDATARILHEAGMLKKSASANGWQIRMPRLKHLNNVRPWAYALLFAPDTGSEEKETPRTRKTG
jgi:putative DNA primase/helicase